MCAIAGILKLEFNKGIVDKMLATMLRRGPDDTGMFAQPEVCLLHTRLAVMDPARGAQPMETFWEGEQYVICYNGELYNTQEIRQALEKEGHHFFTDTDTEVVLHAYAQWKENALHMLNGIFAFAVWEKNNRRLFLARDRMGVKPLFFMEHKGGLLFASEIKTILSYPGVYARLDADGVAELLLLGPGRTPGSGVLQGMRELKPGEYAVYSSGKLQIQQYWKLRDREHRESFWETVDTVRTLVEDAIRRQMVSDVPIGAFLSGGLDSSLICGICAGEMQKKNMQLDTFSLDFVDNDKNFKPGKFQPESDGAYIRVMEKMLRSKHHWTVLSAERLLDAMEAATEARDLPGMADVDFSLLAFCREIRKDVKVALSGECADEIFGGYPWYRDPEIREQAGFPWSQNVKQRTEFIHPHYRGKVKAAEFVMDRYQQTVSASDILPGTPPGERRMKEMVNLNHYWFMQTLLERKDRMSMYSGLEVRVPFCDYRIAEYLYGVPWAFKDHKGREKGLLRTAMEGTLPDSVLWRKKSPYPKTYDPRYLMLVNHCLQSILNDGDAPILQLVDRSSLEKLLVAEYEWPWYGQLMKVPQTIAYMLQIDHWLRTYQVSLV